MRVRADEAEEGNEGQEEWSEDEPAEESQEGWATMGARGLPGRASIAIRIQRPTSSSAFDEEDNDDDDGARGQRLELDMMSPKRIQTVVGSSSHAVQKHNERRSRRTPTKPKGAGTVAKEQRRAKKEWFVIASLFPDHH
jgi:hypothetical protein